MRVVRFEIPCQDLDADPSCLPYIRILWSKGQDEKQVRMLHAMLSKIAFDGSITLLSASAMHQIICRWPPKEAIRLRFCGIL